MTDQMTIIYDLEAPLLNEDEHDSTCLVSKTEEPLNFPRETTTRLNSLSFGTGSFAGLLTQVILSVTLWDQSILSKPTVDLVEFSFSWAIMTCLLVNCTMVFFIRDMKASFCPEQCESAWTDVSRRMEAWMIGGALASISAWWFTLDTFGIALPLSNYGIMDLVIVATTILVIFFALTTPKGRGALLSSSSGISNCLASFLGFVIGFASQILLSYLLYTGKMPAGAMSNVFLFAICWSVCTVLITLAGCLSLRIYRPKSSETVDAVEVERMSLRMESFYVLCSLIGICFAWITLDMALGMTKQMIPSLVMIFISAIIFRAILYCFPEDMCLEEMDFDDEE
eukprot:CAMPEP_0198137080 /NCGR_PEP_ID=MMETSP1443-20131203/644_1 /TAXON_ID=186043 /ORGANISM="Entomoneis sp., Strain CCMP2396" /LENGTH=339 /DNA_ID=CAMNT_0043798411 /DNA_START=46 /DNA_END=1065 /DNA_ORIENTATION=+